jgi:hypothetical protein
MALLAMMVATVPYSIRKRSALDHPSEKRTMAQQPQPKPAPVVPPKPVPPTNFDVRTGVKVPSPR